MSKGKKTGKYLTPKIKKSVGAPKKNYRSKVFSIRHKKEVIDEVRRKFNRHELTEKGKKWLDQLAKTEQEA